MIVKESLNFQRGLNPKRALDIGGYHDLEEKFSDLMVQKLVDEKTCEKWGVYNSIKMWLEEMDPELSLDLKYRFIQGEDPNQVCLGLLNKADFPDKDLYLRKIKKLMKKPFWRKIMGESLNFERGQDPLKKMKIGHIRPIEELEKDYNRMQELIREKNPIWKNIFIGEVLPLITNHKNFGWGNIHYNFKNMGRDELYPFEQLVQEYTELLGLDEPQR
jgi:hypothetical protein